MSISDRTLSYGRVVETELSYEHAVSRAKELLKAEGFGVLCEIDVAKTLKEKIGVDIPPMIILGACNPQLAHRALEAEPYLGLLLPCNVVVREAAGKVTVSAVDVAAMLALTKKAALDTIASDVQTRLQRVLDGMNTQSP